MALGQSHQIEVVPLSMTCDASKGHPTGAIEVFRQKRLRFGMGQPAYQPQGFVRRLEWGQRLRHPRKRSRAGQKPERPKLHLWRGSESAFLKETMHAPMVHMLRNQQGDKTVGIQQIGHSSYRAALTSSRVTGTPSFLARRIPFRFLNAL